MALPTIRYNASGGSDTAASGAGPDTAVTGTAAAHTNGSGSTTITLTNSPDLSGVATDGSAALWLGVAGANRNLTKITAVDNGAKTVTVEDSFNIASGSPVNYAIGGKRQTMEANTSRRDWLDYRAGWTAQFEAGTYNYGASLTPPDGDATSGAVTFCNASGASPVLNSTANVPMLAAGVDHTRWKGLKFTTTSGTKTSCFLLATGSTGIVGAAFEDCTVDGLQGVVAGFNEFEFFMERCLITNCIADVGTVTAGNYMGRWIFDSCKFLNNGADVFDISNSGAVPGHLALHRCVLHGNTGSAVKFAQNTATSTTRGFLDIHGSTIDGNGDGIALSGSQLTSLFVMFSNNIISNHSGGGDVGFSLPSAGANVVMRVNRNNAWYNNSTHRSNLVAGIGDIDLSADPYTAQSSDDFTLNDTAGGGADLKAAAFTSTGDFLDIGAYQSEAGAGGGTGSIFSTPIIRAA